MIINITKSSGVISIKQDTNTPKYFFGLTGNYTAMSNGTTILIQIGGTSLQVELSNLRVNGQTPSSLSTALTLLNSIFGS